MDDIGGGANALLNGGGNTPNNNAGDNPPANNAGDNQPHPLADKYKWLGQVSDPSIYDLAEKKGWNSPLVIAENYRNLETLLGKKADVPVRPADDAAPEEWSKYYDKLGRPKTPDDYKLTFPKTNSDPDFNKSVSNWFYEAGLDTRQANIIASKFNEHVTKLVDDENKAFLAKSNSDISELHQELGGKFDDTMEVARRGFRVAEAAGLTKDSLDALERAIGTKTMLKMFAEFGKMTVEANAPGGDNKGFESTAEFAKAKIRELRASPDFQSRYMSNDPNVRSEAIREMEKWQKQAWGDAPVT